MENANTPIIGYVRVSTNMQQEHGSSLSAQCLAVKQYAERNGSLVAIFEDVESGKNDERTGLREALALACKCKGTLLVLNISRLGRTVLSSLKWIDVLRKRGANFASISESINTNSPMGMFQLQLMVSLAEMEAAQIKSRVTFTMAHLRKQNKRISGFIPYGYTLADDGEMLLEDDEQQLVLKRIETEHLAGSSLRKIVDGLNADGIPTAKGFQWKRGTVYHTLERMKKLAAA